MKPRPLPAIEKLRQLQEADPAEAKAFTDRAAVEFFSSIGAQFVFSIIQTTEFSALQELRNGGPTPTERLVGVIQTCAMIRGQLTALLPDDQALADEEPEEEEDVAELYSSGFDIPYPRVNDEPTHAS